MHKILCFVLIILSLLGCKEESKGFSGYIDTDLIYLSADFGGRLADLAVLKGQVVKKAQFLFRLEQTAEHYSIDMSELGSKDLAAERQQLLIQLNYNKITFERVQGMRKHSAASQADLDLAEKDFNNSKQQLAAIEAKIKNSQVDTAYKKWQATRKENFATDFGIIFDTYYTKGEFVQPGYPILSLITQTNVKAIFFVPEEKLNQIALNKKVKITTSADSNIARGHIFYISNIAEYTPPIIYSREERKHLVFRVEAKIDAPDLEKLHLGQPVTLELVA